MPGCMYLSVNSLLGCFFKAAPHVLKSQCSNANCKKKDDSKPVMLLCAKASTAPTRKCRKRLDTCSTDDDDDDGMHAFSNSEEEFESEDDCDEKAVIAVMKTTWEKVSPPNLESEIKGKFFAVVFTGCSCTCRAISQAPTCTQEASLHREVAEEIFI